MPTELVNIRVGCQHASSCRGPGTDARKWEREVSLKPAVWRLASFTTATGWRPATESSPAII